MTMRPSSAMVCLSLLGAALSPVYAASPEVLPVNIERVQAVAAANPDLAAPEMVYAASLNSKGEWSDVNGWSTWTYALQIPGALSLSFHAAVSLPPGAKVSLAGADGQTLKTYSFLNSVAAAGHIWSIMVPGDTVGLTLTVPTDQKQLTRLDIDKVFVGAKASPLAKQDDAVVRATGAPAVSWSCDRSSANEIPGDATIGFTVYLSSLDGSPGLGECTGTLLADVPKDNREFLLTAAHCGATNWDPSTLTAYWNAVTPCGSLASLSSAATATTSGGTTRAVYGYFGSDPNNPNAGDEWLIELAGGIPANSDAAFSGWIASDVTAGETTGPANVFGINDGAIESKQYTASTAGPTQVIDGFITYAWSTGSTAGGASGSGIYNASQQLFGTLSGANNLTASPVGEYNLLSQSWHGDTGNNDPASSTSVWLDPNNTGTLSVTGYMAPAAATAPTVSVTASAATVTVGQAYTVSWSSAGATSCTGSNGLTGQTGLSGQISVTPTAAGSVDYVMTCANASLTGSNSTTVVVNAAATGGSSGGGSSSSSSSSSGGGSSGSTSGGGTPSGSSSSGGSGSSLGPAATPTIVTSEGPYTSLPLYIPITDSTPGATIYYSTDGSTPTTSSNVYTGPVPVSTSETLAAIAVAPGYTSSAVASETFSVPGSGGSGTGGGAFGPMTLLPLLGFVGLRRRKSKATVSQ